MACPYRSGSAILHAIQVSGPEEAGEGEHKISRQMLRPEN